MQEKMVEFKNMNTSEKFQIFGNKMIQILEVLKKDESKMLEAIHALMIVGHGAINELLTTNGVSDKIKNQVNQHRTVIEKIQDRKFSVLDNKFNFLEDINE